MCTGTSCTDDDGDLITVACDSDVVEAIQYHAHRANTTLSVYVRGARMPSMSPYDSLTMSMEGSCEHSAMPRDLDRLVAPTPVSPMFQPVMGAAIALDPCSTIGSTVSKVIQHFCLPLPMSNPKVC